jgi:hypothetical protein
VTPEYVVAAVITIVLGWGGFTWRRAESACEDVLKVSNRVDALSLKIAEKYLTREDFELQMDRLFTTLARFEKKLDFHVYQQADSINNMQQRLQRYELLNEED